MIMITGWSQKLDGVAFLAETDDVDAAYQMMVDNWNSRFDDHTKIVRTEEDVYLLFTDVKDEVISDFEDEVPRREGWQLIAREIAVGSVIESMPW